VLYFNSDGGMINFYFNYSPVPGHPEILYISEGQNAEPHLGDNIRNPQSL